MTRVPPAAIRSARRADARTVRFAADVEYYMAQEPRQLPSRYLYDALGSALFEAICRLPWYRVTRAEERLLARYGRQALQRVAPLSTVVELGCGSGEKLRLLLDQGRSEADALAVHLVDLSSSALESSARAMAAVANGRVVTHHASYEDGLREVGDSRDAGGRVLVLFLGSNIGNFDAPGASAFLRGIRSQLRAGDALLLGADLVKPERELLLAYDDPLGVTAAFNRNLLVRINRELGGDFDIGEFAHRAVWSGAESRVEMHLVARSALHVHIEAAGMAFAMREGEHIWTESSYKYWPGAVVELLESAAFRLSGQWIDAVDQFALTLVEAA